MFSISQNKRIQFNLRPIDLAAGRPKTTVSNRHRNAAGFPWKIWFEHQRQHITAPEQFEWIAPQHFWRLVFVLHWIHLGNRFHLFHLDIPTTAQNQFAWHPSGELHMSMPSNAGSVSLDTRLVYFGIGDLFLIIILFFHIFLTVPTKTHLKTMLRLCPRIVQVLVRVIHSKQFNKSFINRNKTKLKYHNFSVSFF